MYKNISELLNNNNLYKNLYLLPGFNFINTDIVTCNDILCINSETISDSEYNNIFKLIDNSNSKSTRKMRLKHKVSLKARSLKSKK